MAAGLTIAEIVTTRQGVRLITTAGAKGQSETAANPWDEVLDDGKGD
ncbi:MAG: hypothetical protein VYD64_02555 [Pseudomonadota bacterium]|nr:hypothetical protein [Pseudomonadota bacterium]